jgi:hypothetical protein
MKNNPKVRVVSEHEIIVTPVPAKEYYHEPDPEIEKIVARMELKILRAMGLI